MFTTRVLVSLASTAECGRPRSLLVLAGRVGLSGSLRTFLSALPGSCTRSRPPPRGTRTPGRVVVCAAESQGTFDLKASPSGGAQENVRNNGFWLSGHTNNNRWRFDGGGGGDGKVFNAPLPVAAVFGLSFLSMFWGNEDDEEKTPEEKIIHLLKQAKLCVLKKDLKGAEKKLHEALFLAEEEKHTNAIIYTYDLMANVAFLAGKLDSAETLFKATLGLMLSSGVEKDNNAAIEISLKLAAIYAMQGKNELAVLGYEWCVKLMEEKLVRLTEVTDGSLSEEYKANTRLLLGMTLDSFGRYLRANGHWELARQQYVKALAISHEVQGEQHPQTVVLMSDLATTLDALGRFAEAEELSGRASIIAEETEHPEQPTVFLNHAGVLLHQENYSLAEAMYMKALKLAQKHEDAVTAQEVKKGLDELQKRRAKSQIAAV